MVVVFAVADVIVVEVFDAFVMVAIFLVIVVRIDRDLQGSIKFLALSPVFIGIH